MVNLRTKGLPTLYTKKEKPDREVKANDVMTKVIKSQVFGDDEAARRTKPTVTTSAKPSADDATDAGRRSSIAGSVASVGTLPDDDELADLDTEMPGDIFEYAAYFMQTYHEKLRRDEIRLR